MNLSVLKKQHELPEMAYPSIINTYHEVKSIQKHFQKLERLLFNKANLVEKLNQCSEINQTFQKRCTNYKDDPKRMIDSIMDRNKISIIIDKLLVNKGNNTTVLLLDPVEIKIEVSKYFQTCAISKDTTLPVISD